MLLKDTKNEEEEIRHDCGPDELPGLDLERVDHDVPRGIQDVSQDIPPPITSADIIIVIRDEIPLGLRGKLDAGEVIINGVAAGRDRDGTTDLVEIFVKDPGFDAERTVIRGNPALIDEHVLLMDRIERKPRFTLAICFTACQIDRTTNGIAVRVIEPPPHVVIGVTSPGILPGDTEPVIHRIELNVRVRLTMSCSADIDDVPQLELIAVSHHRSCLDIQGIVARVCDRLPVLPCNKECTGTIVNRWDSHFCNKGSYL